jgi:hypothetical protein
VIVSWLCNEDDLESGERGLSCVQLLLLCLEYPSRGGGGGEAQS